MASYRYVIAGRVQGVGYRYFVRQKAESLKISGFARNLPGGSVEVVAEGDDEGLARFEDLLRQGPDFASVSTVERASIAPRGDQGFHIR
jgi:acylphosphatase